MPTSSSGLFTTNSETYYDTPSAPGTYFCFIVTDSSGHTAQSGPTYVAVSGATQPLSSSISASPNPVLLGANFNISATWSGGTPPYTVYLHTSSVTSSLLCSNSGPESLGTATTATSATTYYSTSLLAQFSPNTPAIYLCLVANDSAGHTSQSTVTVSISKTPTTTISTSSLSSSIRASSSSVAAGQNVTIYANWSGGTPPYNTTLYSSYTNTCSGTYTLEAGTTATSGTYTSAPAAPGIYYCFIVNDSLRHSSKSGPHRGDRHI